MCALLAWHPTPTPPPFEHTYFMDGPMANTYDLIFQIKPGSFICTRCTKSFKTATSLEKHEKSHKEDIYTDQHVVLLVKSATEMCITNGIHDENIISALSSYQINIKSITALKDYLNSLHSNKQC